MDDPHHRAGSSNSFLCWFHACPPIEGINFNNTFGQGIAQRLRLNSPGPIPHGSTGEIHSSLTSQRQEVLHGSNSHLRDGSPGGSDHIPGNIPSIRRQISPAKILCGGGGCFIPTCCCIVIMGPRINNAFCCEAMRQEFIV